MSLVGKEISIHQKYHTIGASYTIGDIDAITFVNVMTLILEMN